MATRNYELTGETRNAAHQKSAPQEHPLPKTVSSPRGNAGRFTGKRGSGNSRGEGK